MSAKEPDPNDTLEMAIMSLTGEEPSPAGSSFVRVDFASASHPGKVRSNNEDHFLCLRYGRFLETLQTNLPEGRLPKYHEEVGYAMLVADGMGGAAAGEVASRTAIQVMVNLVLETPDWIVRGGEPEVEEVMQRMAERYRRIDAVLTERAEADPELSGMGTTMTLACSIGARLILAHVGDSRAYLARGGELHQLTCDHTMAQSLADMGILRQEEVGTHRLRHALTRALGGKGGQCEAQVQRVALADRDQILLCTDGLTDMVDDASIRAVLADALTAHDACEALIDYALAAGGRDNVTVVLARYEFLHGA